MRFHFYIIRMGDVLDLVCPNSMEKTLDGNCPSYRNLVGSWVQIGAYGFLCWMLLKENIGNFYNIGT